jgi:hypothetical protein
MTGLNENDQECICSRYIQVLCPYFPHVKQPTIYQNKTLSLTEKQIYIDVKK